MPGGRPKGARNQTSIALRDAIENAFVKVGGVDYLEIIAREDPKTFCALLSKILPKDIKIEGDLSLQVTKVEREIIEPSITYPSGKSIEVKH